MATYSLGTTIKHYGSSFRKATIPNGGSVSGNTPVNGYGELYIYALSIGAGNSIQFNGVDVLVSTDSFTYDGGKTVLKLIVPSNTAALVNGSITIFCSSVQFQNSP